MTSGWFVLFHERGHLVHNSPYNFGSTQTFTRLPEAAGDHIDLIEINRKEVSYLNDSSSPCQLDGRVEDLNTCIQHYIEYEIGCQMSWNIENTTLTKCTLPDQFTDFMAAYDKIASLSSSAIAMETNCLPSCRRNEYSIKIIERIHIPDQYNRTLYQGFLVYPSGRYIKKDYYYTYDFESYIADVGGLMGLFLGHSLISFYDIIKEAWKNKKKLC